MALVLVGGRKSTISLVEECHDQPPLSPASNHSFSPVIVPLGCVHNLFSCFLGSTMDFDALDALGREILDDARDESFLARDAEHSILAADDSDDDEELELENGFATLEIDEGRLEIGKEGDVASSLPSGLASGVEERLSRRTDRLSTRIDFSFDEKAVHDCLGTLESIFPPKDRKLLLLTSALRASTVPARSNSTSFLVAQPAEDAALTSLLKVDLLKRMFLSEKSTPSPFTMDLPAALLRDLLVEELKHTCRLMQLVHTVIEPLQSAQKEDAEISRFLAPFALVAASHFDHVISLAKAMNAEWPSISQLTVGVFHKWIFVLPLYADLAASLLYNASKIQEITHNQTLKVPQAEGETGEREMPLLDVLNEPFNHLPKYQFFIESLLSNIAKEAITEAPTGEEKTLSPQASNNADLFSQWCQTLAILQQSLKYLTKCYHRSDKRCNLRRFIERLGSDAPTTLRNADHHKLIGGHDILVNITDHRRKRRKRGFVAILSDCLVLSRCEGLNASIAAHNHSSHAGSSSHASNRASMSAGKRKTEAFTIDRSSYAPTQDGFSYSSYETSGSSSPTHLDSKAAAEAMKKAKKAKKEEEKRNKKLEKEAKRKGTFSRSNATSPTLTHQTTSSAADSSTSNKSSSGQPLSPTSADSARRSTSISTHGYDKSRESFVTIEGGSKRSSTHPSNSRHSARARSISAAIPRSVITHCPLRFVAMLYFDQLAIQMDAQVSDDSEAAAIIIWACDTKFTIEFEQQSHKEEWLRHFARNEARKVAKKMGPFSRTLSELYCLPSSGIPTAFDRHSILESFLNQDPETVRHWSPPFLNHLLSPFNDMPLDFESIIKCSVPPRTTTPWKNLKSSLRESWQSTEIPADLSLPVLHEFLSKLAEPLMPSVMLDVIATQWDEEDCGDVRKIRNFVAFLPAFNLYALSKLCYELHLVVQKHSKHVCSVPLNDEEASEDESKSTSLKLETESTQSSNTPSLGSLANQVLAKRRPRAGKDSSKSTVPMRTSSMGIALQGLTKMRSSSEQPAQTVHGDAIGIGRKSIGENADKARKGSSSSEILSNALRSRTESSSDGSSTSSATNTPRDMNGFAAALENPWATSGPQTPSPLSSSARASIVCPSSPLAWLISSAFAPAVMRPFKITGAAPIAVANYIGRLSRFVHFFASLIDHAPYVFAALSNLSPTDYIASFDDLRSSLQGERRVLGASSDLTIADIDASGSSSAQSSNGNLSNEGDAVAGGNGGGKVDSSNRDSIFINTNPGLGMAHSGSSSSIGRKGTPTSRDARRATMLFHFDMAGLVTESFSVMEFALLHFALAPPGYR